MSPESGSETVRVLSMLASDLLQRRETAFTFWIPNLRQRPVLVIGNFAAGNPNDLANRRDIRLVQDSTHSGLWAVTATDTGLSDGIYHYWFQVENSNPVEPAAAPIFCTDPFATTV